MHTSASHTVANQTVASRALRAASLLLRPALGLFAGVLMGLAPPVAGASAETADTGSVGSRLATVSVPAQSAWTDYGEVLEGGALGDWDYQNYGGMTLSAVKKNGKFYLYYQGTCCYRMDDESVTFRAIGVATSDNGVDFSKHPSNPVVEWFPTGNGEEGAASGAPLVDDDGSVLLYYGANTAISPELVNADGRLAVSSNGAQFTDQGIVLDQSKASVWGSGDELFPVAALRDQGKYVLFYMPNGSPQRRKLGVAWGGSRGQLNQTAGVTSNGADVQLLGPASLAQLGDDQWAIFLNYVPERRFEARTFSASSPTQMSAPVVTYQFAEPLNPSVLLDRSSSTWFMYYRVLGGGHGLMLAPMGEPDTTGPPAPTGLVATARSHDTVELSWPPATDPQTGVVQYVVFRDGERLGTTFRRSFVDQELDAETPYEYKISAVNYHGFEGPSSAGSSVTTPEDVTPPRVAFVTSSGSPIEVVVGFDEPVTVASAEKIANYKLSGRTRVVGASLAPDMRTLTLTTTDLVDGASYRLSAGGVKDASPRSNQANGIRVDFSHSSAPGLVGSWRFEDSGPSSDVVADTSNFGSDGSSAYPSGAPVSRQKAKMGRGLHFDGVDDLVTVWPADRLAAATLGSHSLAVWAKPDALPKNDGDDTRYHSIVTRGSSGLFYDADGRWRASVRLAGGNFVDVRSPMRSPGSWVNVVMVVDAQQYEVRLFLDGAEVGESPKSYSGALYDHGTEPYYFGTSDPLVERYDNRFRGSLDEVLVFDRALGSGQVDNLAFVSPETRNLNVELEGSGSGRVTSVPAGLVCGTDCEEDFTLGLPVQLGAEPLDGSTFGGWTGSEDCQDGFLTLVVDHSCTARFDSSAALFEDGFESGTLSAWDSQ